MATIRKRGNAWHAQIRRSGASSLTQSFRSKTDAQEWARKIEHQIYAGVLPEKRQGHSLPLKEVLERYLLERTTLKKGAQSETYRIRKLQRSWLGDKALGNLSSRDVLKYWQERLGVIKSSSLRRELVILRHCLALAHRDWGLYVGDSLLRMSLPKDSSRRERRLHPHEVQELKAHAMQCRNPLILPMVLLALQTGLRRSELLAARWAGLDLERRSLTICDSKNGHSRLIPLTRDAVGILRGLPMKSDRLFPMTANAFRLSWERLVKRAGVQDLHFHDLRHEAISRFFELGLSVPEVALISGHKDMRMLFRYTHPSRQRILGQFDNASDIQLHSMEHPSLTK